jgi:gas vesicle protein
MYSRDYEGDYAGFSAFLAGALIGAGVALLLAPQTGSELRGMLRSYANRAKDEISERGREAWDTAVERGKDYMETGKEAMRDAGKTAREYVETGKETAREAGRQATGNRG